MVNVVLINYAANTALSTRVHYSDQEEYPIEYMRLYMIHLKMKLTPTVMPDTAKRIIRPMFMIHVISSQIGCEWTTLSFSLIL